jgi:hypothetical protein
MPSGKNPSASGLCSAAAMHYAVIDTVGNCAVVDAKPDDGLKIIGDKGGSTSLNTAKKALRDAKAKCKGNF